MSINANRPNLMVGVPTGYLSPRLPFPPNTEATATVGVELAPGLGISLDGKALLVGAGGHQGRTEIAGRLDDGSFPQRDSVVLRSGQQTTIDGHYSWQDYQLDGSRDNFRASGERAGFNVSTTDQGFRVESPLSGKTWTVEATASGYAVRSDFEGGETFQVSRQGNTTLVDSNLPDQDFTVTQKADGAAIIDGHLSTDDFSWTPTARGFELQGHHPQQRFGIELS